jgi:hypothetical protein
MESRFHKKKTPILSKRFDAGRRIVYLVRRPKTVNDQATGDEEIFSVFDEALPVIHATLVSFYRFMEEEAEAFEDTLLVWFERMARRNASQKIPISELRAQLLYVACKYARAFQIARFKGIEPAEEKFTMALAQTPEEVAAKLLHKF